MLTALLVLAILIFLIVVHELGHFIAAKIFQVRVEEFGIGYPPRAFTLGRIGETEYTLNWIPFGGFVRLFGDVGEDQHGRGSLVDANRAAQAIILLAGVGMNAVAAWALFTGALHFGIPRAVAEAPVGAETRLLVAHIVPGSPAESAGIKAGDEILAVADRESGESAELTPKAFSEFIFTRGGEPVELMYLHGEATATTTLTPAHAVLPEEEGRPAIGMAVYLVTAEPLPWGEAAKEAVDATRGAFLTVGKGLWYIIDRVLHGNPDISGVVGPVGLFGVVGDAAQSGFASVLRLAGFISANLVLVNLIPIPALDGGRLALLAIESVIRRSAPRVVLQLLNALGVALIVLLMVTVTFNDIGRLLG